MFSLRKFIKKRINKTEYEMEEYRKRGVKIGKNSCIINSFIDYSHGFLVTIGENTTLTNVTVLTHDASTKRHMGYTKVARVNIGNNCYLGYGSIILPGAVLEDDCIVGAGTVVRGTVPAGSVVAGNPMKILCTTEEYISKNKQRMEKSPRFNKVFKKMSDEEKKEAADILQIGVIGYEP